jgi:hypothetical protein
VKIVIISDAVNGQSQVRKPLARLCPLVFSILAEVPGDVPACGIEGHASPSTDVYAREQLPASGGALIFLLSQAKETAHQDPSRDRKVDPPEDRKTAAV